jgi:calcineurin-like phosphoesterase family protein
LAVTRGYRATKYSRPHGFSTNIQHQLTITKSPIFETNEKAKLIDYSGTTWCIKNRNQNFLARREGRVHLTGNSHGTLPDDPNSLSFDVGVDCWDFRPITFKEVAARMATKNYKPVDHHNVTVP